MISSCLRFGVVSNVGGVGNNNAALFKSVVAEGHGDGVLDVSEDGLASITSSCKV